MAAYSKFSAVLRQDGKRVTVGDALQDINDSIASYRAERTSSFDPKTRFCLELYELFGFETAPYGDVDNLARTKNVSVAALQAEHLLVAEAGRSFLVPLRSYPAGVTELDRRFAGSTWEACLRLAATLQEEGEAATAALARELGEGVCARARELAVWLYTIADARKRTQDALTFNALDASWPEIQRLMAAMDRGGQQGRFA
jgi:putative DNA methylase